MSINLLLTILAFYTLLMVGGIHYYEAKIKDLQASISDYKRALSLSNHSYSAAHYTELQLNYQQLKKDYIALLNKSQPSQYESSFYHSPTWGD